ncbi:hypothetical protein C8J57DRAFT_1326218, partial [Mycena rebaudengoi]
SDSGIRVAGARHGVPKSTVGAGAHGGQATLPRFGYAASPETTKACRGGVAQPATVGYQTCGGARGVLKGTVGAGAPWWAAGAPVRDDKSVVEERIVPTVGGPGSTREGGRRVPWWVAGREARDYKSVAEAYMPRALDMRHDVAWGRSAQPATVG